MLAAPDSGARNPSPKGPATSPSPFPRSVRTWPEPVCRPVQVLDGGPPIKAIPTAYPADRPGCCPKTEPLGYPLPDACVKDRTRPVPGVPRRCTGTEYPTASEGHISLGCGRIRGNGMHSDLLPPVQSRELGGTDASLGARVRRTRNRRPFRLVPIELASRPRKARGCPTQSLERHSGVPGIPPSADFGHSPGKGNRIETLVHGSHGMVHDPHGTYGEDRRGPCSCVPPYPGES